MAAGYAEVTWVNAAPIEPTLPAPPAGAAAAGGNRSVTLTWDSPVAWLATTYYQYRYRPASGAWTRWAVLHPRNRAHTISGLSSGAHYEIEMRAATDTGFSDPVGVFASTAATAPAAPAGLAAAGGDGWVDLSWDNPGDSSIVGYHTMNWITNGLRYQVQIRALNVAGAGNPSQTTATPTPGP